ncbi:MAG: DUF2871 domain-containing protein [Eubacterium sp.]|nr:DUF2871 domain-containing protein [Eubacterium sp.]
MRKLLNTSMIYFVSAIIAGVFYREFTKLKGFTGETMLRFVHTHLFVLGMILFLVIALYCKAEHGLLQDQTFRRFFVLYNIALPFMACTMLARGILQVLNPALTRTVDAMISGFAGISHILLTIAVWMLFCAIRKNIADESF